MPRSCGHPRTPHLNGHITANASHEGRVFLELELDLGEAFNEQDWPS